MDIGNIGLIIASFFNLTLFVKGVSIGSIAIGILSLLSFIILVLTFFEKEEKYENGKK